MRKTSISLLVASLILAVSAGGALALQGGLSSFGIRPTEAMEDRPETFSYFSHSAEAGRVIHDEALVFNDSDQPIDLILYAADGITAQNGGTTFPIRGTFSEGGSREVSNWLVVSVTEIHLEAGEEMVVPFTIIVPDGAAAGHHVAGLVVEAPATGEQGLTTEEESTQFAVQIVRRVGVAVVIDVPGPRSPGLAIDDISLVQQTEAGATFSVLVQNTGNVLTKAEGLLTISAIDGTELASFPLAFDTILPGDLAKFHFSLPIVLAAADYSLNLTVRYGDGDYTTVQDIELRVSDDPAEPGIESANENTGSILFVEGNASGHNLLVDWILANRPLATVIFAALIGLFLIPVILIWRKWMIDTRRN